MAVTHGTDYLIDYYALLGIERDADRAAVRRAYLEKQRLYHPDRFEGLADELKARAAEKSRLLAEAFATLRLCKKRAAYDRRLAEWQGPISKDGTPIIDLAHPHFRPESLLRPDHSADAAKALADLARQMSGHDPATFALLQKLHAASETPAQDVIEAYDRALSCKETYLAIVESVAWEEAGFKNRPLDDRVSVHRGEAIEEQIAEARVRALSGVDEVLTLAAAGEVFLLGPSGQLASEPSDALATISKLREAAAERFEAAAALIRKAADDRATNASAAMGLIKCVYDPPEQAMRPKLLVIIKAGDGQLLIPFRLEGTSIKSETVIPDLENAIADGYSVIRYVLRDGLDIKEQLEKLAFDHFVKVLGPA